LNFDILDSKSTPDHAACRECVCQISWTRRLIVVVDLSWAMTYRHNYRQTA